MVDESAKEGKRLDAWLWVARYFKTRALAKHAVELGRVQVEGQDAKPSRIVRPGVRVTIVRSDETFEVQVKELTQQRGPAKIAITLYEESEASLAARIEARAKARAAHAGYSAPESKPDKRARRLIRALGDIDAT